MIDGSLRQDDYFSMYLYTADFVRTDIPATLEECYAALDSLLDDASKEAIKQSSDNDLIDYHFGLGMWIRNNWVYPTEDRIYKTLLENGVQHPDDMSQIIIEGYHRYLNNDEYSIETYRDARQSENTEYLARGLRLLFVFVFIIITVRYFFRKLPCSIRLFKKVIYFHFTEVLLALCILAFLVIKIESFIDTGSLSITTYSVGFVSALIFAFMFIIAVVRFLCMLLQGPNNISTKNKRSIIFQIISIVFITIFLLGYIEHVNFYEELRYHFYIIIVLLIIITIVCKILLSKLPRPAWMPDKIERIKIFRVLLALCASTLFPYLLDLAFIGRESYITELIFTSVFALCIAFTALFCFSDMTRKQIAISAVLPTIYFLAYGIESNFFSHGIGYGIFGFFDLDISLLDYIFPMDFILFLGITIGSYWPKFLNIVFAFFPFVYVLLARSKNLKNIEETEAI